VACNATFFSGNMVDVEAGQRNWGAMLNARACEPTFKGLTPAAWCGPVREVKEKFLDI